MQRDLPAPHYVAELECKPRSCMFTTTFSCLPQENVESREDTYLKSLAAPGFLIAILPPSGSQLFPGPESILSQGKSPHLPVFPH